MTQQHQPEPTTTTRIRAPRFCHLRVGAGHLTLCCKRDEADGRYYVGAAWCAPGDQFCRAKGRLIAEGRASCRRSRRLAQLGGPMFRSGWRFGALSAVTQRHGRPNWSFEPLADERLIGLLRDMRRGAVDTTRITEAAQ